jgi:hypothetical protein
MGIVTVVLLFDDVVGDDASELLEDCPPSKAIIICSYIPSIVLQLVNKIAIKSRNIFIFSSDNTKLFFTFPIQNKDGVLTIASAKQRQVLI